MKRQTLRIVLFLSALIVLLSCMVGCFDDTDTEKDIDEIFTTIEKNEMSAYRLGVAAGVNAYMRIYLHSMATGEQFELADVYALADSISGINSIKFERKGR